MKLINGIWLPDTDQHFEAMMVRVEKQEYFGSQVGTYQFNKLQQALKYTKKRRVALDVGAHVGFWSMWLAKEFDFVHAFEPVESHAECFSKNVLSKNVSLHENAVGGTAGYAGLIQDEENSGKAHIGYGSQVEVITIDSLELEKVDLIKIDVEGYELQVILGAVDTIARCKPFIVIEQNGVMRDAGMMLESLGMTLKKIIGSDFFYGWKR
jgi:FkbM family methyltransferase